MRSFVKVGEEEKTGGGTRTHASIAKIDANMRFCLTLQRILKRLINANQTLESVVLVLIKKMCLICVIFLLPLIQQLSLKGFELVKSQIKTDESA